MTKKTLKIPHRLHNKLDQIRVQKNKENPEYSVTFPDVIKEIIEEAGYETENLSMKGE